MKKFALVLGMVASGAVLLTAPRARGQGLVALYRFAETNTSQLAADSSTNGLDGTYEFAVMPGQPGVFTSGLDTNSAAFDGITASVLLPQSPLFNSPDLTIEFWMNPGGGSTGYMMPVTRGAPNNPWAIYLPPPAVGSSEMQVGWVAQNASVGLLTPAVVQPGVWQHVAVVQAGTNAAIYLNGQLAASGVQPPAPPPTAGILIGRRGDGDFLDGALDNVALFNGVLSTDQMQSDMNTGPAAGEPGLIALWKFNETGTGGPALDSSGHGLNGTYEGGVSLAPGFTNSFGNAAQFDGSSGYVVVPPNPVFFPASITIEFWINVSGSNYASYSMPVTCDLNNGQYNGNTPWTVQLEPAGSATEARTISWIAYGLNVNADQALPPDSWHFIAITQTGNTGQIYVDGVLAASGGNAGLGDPSIYIAQREDGYYFQGSMADVAFFNTVLSPSQIQNSMSNGVATGPVTPEITIWTQPQSALAAPGQAATLSVAAYVSGGNINLYGYQWQKNAVNVADATNSSYVTPPLTLADNGSMWDCLVSYPGSTSLTSAVATLTVKAPTGSVWTNLAGGSWKTAANWSNQTVPNGVGAVADFSELALPLPLSVTLDGSFTVGSMIFGDKGSNTNNSWEIDPGSGGRLTMSATNTPSITALNETTTLAAGLTASHGLTIAGAGALELVNNNTLLGGVTVNGGNLVFGVGGVFTLAPEASSLTINNGGTVQWNGTANSDNIVNGPLPITVNAGGVLSATARSTMGYDYANNYANITLNGGTFSMPVDGADQYINTITLNGGTVTGPGVIAFWYAIPTAVLCPSNSTIATGLALNNSFIANINVSSGQTLTVGYFQSPGGTVNLTGGGTMVVTDDTSQQYPYTGLTTISNGTMIVNALLGSGAVNVYGALGGDGTIGNSVQVFKGGTLMVGADESAAAVPNTLTVAAEVDFHAGSKCFLRVSKTGGVATNDMISAGSVLYGGALTVANITSDTNRLAAGDTFTLFQAATNYTGNFTNMTLPALDPGLAWTWTPTNGTLVVTTSLAPVWSGFGPLLDGSFKLTFTGVNGRGYSVLTTTNAALPLTNWTVLTTGTFGAGVVNYTDATATNGARFYEIQTH